MTKVFQHDELGWYYWCGKNKVYVRYVGADDKEIAGE